MRSPSCFFCCVNILLEKRCWRTGISKKQWVFLYNLDYKILLNSNIQNQMHRICFLGVAIKWAAILLLSFPCCCTDQDSDSVTVRWLLHHIFYFCPSFRAGRAHLEQKSQQCVGRWECPTDDCPTEKPDVPLLSGCLRIWHVKNLWLSSPVTCLLWLSDIRCNESELPLVGEAAYSFIFRNVFFLPLSRLKVVCKLQCWFAARSVVPPRKNTA